MTSQWQLQPIFGSYPLAAALGFVLFFVLMVRPSFGQLSNSRLRWLNVIRGLIAFLLLIAALRPTYIRSEKQAQTAELLVLFDTSRSMGHRDATNGGTRWNQQMSIIRNAMPQLQDMGDSFNVELIGFSEGITPQEKSGDRLAISSQPTGEETDMGRALMETLQRHVGKRIAAVVLLGDGAQRALEAKTQPQQAARQLDRTATPLYTIAIGRSRDQSQSRDVAIENLRDEYSVFVKNEFALRVGVRIQGYVNQTIPVTVVVEDEEGQSQTLGPQELIATEDSQIVMADFEFRPERAGEYKLRVRAAGQPGELIDNNEKTAFLTVRDGGIRALLLTSAVFGSEEKFIRRALDESQDIELDVHLENVKGRSRWRLDLETRVPPLDDYDVFIIGNIDEKAYRQDNWGKIAKLVEAERGLMMYGGTHSFGPGGYAENPLANVLPVEMRSHEREPDPTKRSRTDRHIEGEIVVLPAEPSSITHLSPDDRNEATWRRLKPLLGANRFVGRKDSSSVLLTSEDGEPMLVSGGYGNGRVLALATNSTYRWWRYGEMDLHKKFWRQCVLWLARRDKQQANSVFITLPQRRFQARRRVQFQTGLTDDAGDVLADADLQATIVLPDGSSETVPLNRNTAASDPELQNALGGMLTKTEAAGDYRLTVQAMDAGQVVASATKEFVVEKEDFELGDPAANPGLLEMLAKLTERSGGKTIAPEQLPKLLAEIKSSPPKAELETQSKWQLGDHWIDAWACFGLLVLLLSLEWFLRKKWGLV